MRKIHTLFLFSNLVALLVVWFLLEKNFLLLSDDWHVTGRTDSKIEMKEVSGGNGGTDFLTFKKNQ